MAERPAVNASPLIYLAKAGLLDLLQLEGRQIVVPQAVADEICSEGPPDAAAVALRTVDWLQVVPTPILSPSIEAWDLGAGESAVLSWGQTHPGVTVIIDDLAARHCATSLSIPVRGTLGLVLAAKQRGVITAARPVVERLLGAGMYLSQHMIDAALRRVRE